ncbi:galactonate dehydratase [Leptobacterium flavescens]|uniref:Galactonate dehydratase n=1 Tax=Leptobacterium flavescens TaxID=472055 RepID=A0A6P0US69_9FLAO|nr:galactonate dehydratase [Leptobacterium flavescens]NER13723.1 galactonate dehydratase [Leptobacterium flavescens]
MSSISRLQHTDRGLDIVKFELFEIPPRWLFLKLTTANGTVGWGEPVIEGRAATVKAAIEELSVYFLGHSAHHIEDLWQMLYRGGFYRGGPILMSAISGIDQALWDIKAKALGVPVYELLGGAVRNKMRVYGWIGGDKPSRVADAALARISDGYTAVKMNASPETEWLETTKKVDEVIERVARVREAIGDKADIAVDFHGRVHKGMAKILIRELEPYKLLFIEEAVLPENNEVLKNLGAMGSTPLATGERMYSRWDFKPLFESGVIDVAQPDLSHAGGISEVKRIASMAEAYDVALAPHCPLGPIAFAACLQIDFCSVNALIQESSMGIHYNNALEMTEYLLNPEAFKTENGYVKLLERPGLGIEIDEDKVRKMAAEGHQWKNPVWRNEDGSITEW